MILHDQDASSILERRDMDYVSSTVLSLEEARDGFERLVPHPLSMFRFVCKGMSLPGEWWKGKGYGSKKEGDFYCQTKIASPTHFSPPFKAYCRNILTRNSPTPSDRSDAEPTNSKTSVRNVPKKEVDVVNSLYLHGSPEATASRKADDNDEDLSLRVVRGEKVSMVPPSWKVPNASLDHLDSSDCIESRQIFDFPIYTATSEACSSCTALVKYVGNACVTQEMGGKLHPHTPPSSCRKTISSENSNKDLSCIIL